MKSREERKQEYIEYVRRKSKGMMDDTQLILEASKKFDQENPEEDK